MLDMKVLKIISVTFLRSNNRPWATSFNVLLHIHLSIILLFSTIFANPCFSKFTELQALLMAWLSIIQHSITTVPQLKWLGQTKNVVFLVTPFFFRRPTIFFINIFYSNLRLLQLEHFAFRHQSAKSSLSQKPMAEIVHPSYS